MKRLAEYKEEIHSCSKCGLCQSVCPIYKITGSDCTVSRGLFIMLKGIIKGDLRMTKTINRCLDLCLKCGACSKFCPSGINAVDIIAAAKAEYFDKYPFEKFISCFQKIFTFVLGFLRFFAREERSKKFDKKVIYFGGCSGKLRGNKAVVKLLNACKIEVVSPNFDCCGIPFFVRGDLKSYEKCVKKYLDTVQRYGIKDIVTICAGCEKTLRNLSEDINVKNIFEYMFEHIRESNLKLKLKKKQRAAFHKPCNINNYADIKYILDNIENLEYVEMEDFDKCCGLNGIFKIGEYKIMSEIFASKHRSIVNSDVKTVLTSCPGCEAALNLFSFGKYKAGDLSEFLVKNIVF